MKKEWLLLLTLLPGLLTTSCGVDEYYEGYTGSSDMTQQLPVNWSQAANKSIGILTTNFFPQGSTIFGKEIYWDMSIENPEEQFKAFDPSDIKITSQMEGAKVLLENYLRTKNETSLTIAQTIINTITSQIDEENYEVLAQFADVLLSLYDATNDAAVLNKVKAYFTILETASYVAIDPNAEEGNTYTNGKNGIPASPTDDKKTSKGNALGIIVATRLYNIAQTTNDTNAEKYKNFASNVAEFCAGRLYSDTGQTLVSIRIDGTGAVSDQITDYYYYNQGYMIGALIGMYNITKDNVTLDYANTLANFQIKNYNYSSYPVFNPNYSTDANTFLGALDRNLLLSRGIFLRYLKDLFKITNSHSFMLCLTNNAETMWTYGQENENCLWGSRWYEPPFMGEYSSSNSISDPYNPLKVISLEAQIAGTIMLEVKASL